MPCQPARTRFAALGLAAGFLAGGPTACAATDVRTEGFGGANEARIAAYTEHLHVLASEYMEGRLPGTPGIERAAGYLEWNFRRLGLEPAFPVTETAATGQEVISPRATYRQPFPIGDIASLGHQRASLTLNNAPVELAAGSDFNAVAYGVSGTVDLPVTFAGYSILTGPDGYRGYAENADLTGQAVIVLRFEPMNDDGTSRWAGQRDWSYAADLGSKFRAATNRGAGAIILVTPPGAKDDRAGVLETVESSGQVRPVEVPVIHMSPEAADRLIRGGDAEGRSLADLVALANAGGAVVPLPNARAKIDIAIDRRPIMTDNLGAVLPGRGELADEFVVIGAHYDHLGTARFGTRFPGELHLGADDNASGTAGLLTAAEMLTEAWDSIDGPVRSVLFLAFSAEESGLNGSAHYVDNPIAPLDKHYLMINMDMIGSLRNSLEAGGVGSGEGLAELTKPLFDRSGIEVQVGTSVGSGRSDHASFDRRGVPNIFFFTGITDQYHTPDDTADTINLEGGTSIAALAADLTVAAAVREGPLPHIRTGGDGGGRQRMGGPGAMKVRVGIAPGDYSGRTPGILVARVFEGTSAADAGVQEGDVITVWNGEPVKTVEDWMPLLASHNPGDVIQIVLLRDGKEMTLPMTLKARPARGE
jgi:Zn-dependent M28 family amino/carboxypeptidase